MNQLAMPLQPAFALTVLSGKDAGVTYQLNSGRITIGRSSENTIAVPEDPKISRTHATLTIGPNGVEIQDVSERNKMLIGGEEIKSKILVPGDIIQLGSTKFQFKAFSDSEDQQLLARVSAKMSPKLKDTFDQGMAKIKKSRSRISNQGSKTNFYILVAAIVVLFAWLLSSQTQKSKNVELRTSADRETEITTNDKLVEDIIAERTRSKVNTEQYKEAQLHFIKGFRDYRKGQYERAKESFEACRSLFPAHPQCTRYLQLSDKKFSELIQYQMFLASKYKAQAQYAACKAAYQNAWVMIKNPTDKLYIEAKAGFRACKELEGERY